MNTPEMKSPRLGSDSQGLNAEQAFETECKPIIAKINQNVTIDKVNYGAAPAEWHHFAHTLGLLPDLLPVVSNPRAVKSPDSKIAGPGKVPSRYNADGLMSGMHEWTKYVARPSDIERWAGKSDYGICIQTRRIRAIDVDIPDFDKSLDVEEFILGFLGFPLPIRRRPNSCKFLMAFDMPGTFKKRRFKTAEKEEAIEFLAGVEITGNQDRDADRPPGGQQFIAIGTHPSGRKYEWDGGLPSSFPVLSAEKFDALWFALNERFGIEDSVEDGTGIAPTKPRSLDDIDDPLADYLLNHENFRGVDRTGRIDIECPFAKEHTTESGDSATSYFPANVGGFQQGHFRCMHSHCAHRTDNDFKKELGYLAHGFDEIEDDTPSFKSMADLFADLALNDEDISAMSDAHFLIDNLIVQGSLHAFVAPANGGKTTLFIHLCEALAAEGNQIFYINADANPSDLKRQFHHAKQHGYTVIAPDAKIGMGPKDIVERFQLMNKTGADLRNVVIVLDTLKKFSNMIDKKQMRAFLALMRGLTTKGATVCMLAHTNKYAGDDGKQVFEGTGDLRNDVDNMIYLESEKNEQTGRQVITTRPDKVRATFKPRSWWIDLESREVHDAECTLPVMAADMRQVLEAAKQRLAAGECIQSVLASHVSETTGIGKKSAIKALTDLARMERAAIRVTNGENNAKLYSLVDPAAGFDDVLVAD